MKFYAELARNTAFITDGLQFQKWANAEFLMQTLLLKEIKLQVYGLFGFLFFGIGVVFFLFIQTKSSSDAAFLRRIG